MGIEALHPDYINTKDQWKLVDDIIYKKNLDSYLIELNPDDKSPENKSRNELYKKRAIFYAVAAYTVKGSIGTMFRRWPTLDVPAKLDYLKKNADGAGVSIYQQSQLLAEYLVSKSRGGLCCSFPETNGAVSVADLENRKFYATIHLYAPEDICNWSTTIIGSSLVLSTIVLRGVDREFTADYEHKETEVRRELFLDITTNAAGEKIGTYRERKWTKGKDGWQPGPIVTPTDASNNTWEYIPFTFVGAQSNSHDIDEPNMYDLCQMNIGHFRNSAEYEDNVWWCGQSQPWMSGVTQGHVDMMKKNNMYYGSRMMMGVPDGGKMGVASAPANPLCREAMRDKLEMMIGAGARFIKAGTGAKTATESEGDQDMQHSILSLIANNETDAYAFMLECAARFMGATGEMSYVIPQDYLRPKLKAEDLNAIVASWLQGALPSSDLFNFLRKHELIDGEKTDEQILEELPDKQDLPDLENDEDEDEENEEDE